MKVQQSTPLILILMVYLALDVYQGGVVALLISGALGILVLAWMAGRQAALDFDDYDPPPELERNADWPDESEAAANTCASCRHFSFEAAARHFDSYPSMVAMREESGRLWTGRSLAESPRFEDLGACRLKSQIHPHTETCDRYVFGSPAPAPHRTSPARTLRVMRPEDMASLEPLEPLEAEITREAPVIDTRCDRCGWHGSDGDLKGYIRNCPVCGSSWEVSEIGATP